MNMGDLTAKLKRIKLVIADVDGVLTDGAIYKGPEGVEYKRFCVADGTAFALARAANLKIALISGRYSAATTSRVKELGLEDVYNGTLNKLQPYQELKAKHGLEDSEIAYVGDDLIDLVVMERVGLPVAVENAYPQVKAVANYTTRARGGEGAFREVIDLILQGQGRYAEVLQILREKIQQ